MNKITIPISCFFVVISFCLFLFADAPAWAFAIIFSLSVLGLAVLPAFGRGRTGRLTTREFALNAVES